MIDLDLCFELLGQGEQSMLTRQLTLVAGMLAVLILPFVAGSFLAKSFRMPNYGTRLGIVLFAITASVVVLNFWELKYGVDLRGGTILVYEIDQDTSDPDSGERVTADELVGALTERINPSGTLEIVIRPYGDRQIEIIVPDVEESEVRRIKEKVQAAGILQFAIVANERDDLALIETARSQGASKSDIVKDDQGDVIGRWVKVDRENKEVLGDIKPLRVSVSGDVIRNSRTGALLTPPRLEGEYGLEKGCEKQTSTTSMS